MRLQIRPGLSVAWRGPGRLQVGLHPRYGVVLDGLDGADERLLDMLLAGQHDTRALLVASEAAGGTARRVHELLHTLSEAALLVRSTASARETAGLGRPDRDRLAAVARTLSLDPASGGDGWDLVLRRRSTGAAVLGAGRVGLAVAVGLAEAGVGTVVVRDAARLGPHDLAPGGYRSTDLGRTRGAAAADVVARHAPGTRTTFAGLLRPGVTVVCASDAVDPAHYDGLLREDVAHLPVVLREDDAVVGPLVRPGTSCCLRCLDLYRADRDPGWPQVLAQLVTRPERDPDPALGRLAAALAVTQALAEVDGRAYPDALGRTLEVSLAHPVPVLRQWPAHSRCGCRGVPVSGRVPETRTIGT